MTYEHEDDHEDGDATRTPLSMKEAEADADTGVRALEHLLTHAAEDWMRWSMAVKGWRGLRAMAMDRAGTSDIDSQAYRSALTGLFQTRRWETYGRISKMNRSAMTSLMDHIEDIDLWYAKLPPDKQLDWKNPQTIAKWAPRHLVVRRGGNKPPRKSAGPKKKTLKIDEHLLGLLMQGLDLLAKYEPETAARLRAKIAPLDPDDDIGDLGQDDDEDGES
jgi:hypothetical protein